MTEGGLAVEVSWQFHLHEYPAAGEGDQEGGEAYELEHHPIEFWHSCRMGLVENDEAESAEEKHEAGRQALHYVLAIDAVLEK